MKNLKRKKNNIPKEKWKLKKILILVFPKEMESNHPQGQEQASLPF